MFERYGEAACKALFFALSPTLLIYGFMNWDLLAVAFATLGTLAYIERRDTASGVALGLGAATKAYPVLLAIPFVIGRFRERRPVGGTKLAWVTGATWLVVDRQRFPQLSPRLPLVHRDGRWALYRLGA